MTYKQGTAIKFTEREDKLYTKWTFKERLIIGLKVFTAYTVLYFIARLIVIHHF